MTIVYATSSDYTAWTGGTAPANITQLLRSASLMVRDATITAYYAVDTNNLPTDSTILQAFKDATCCHAAAWAALGVDPLTGGVATAKVALSKKVDSAEVQYAGAALAAAARAASMQQLVPEAFRILQEAIPGLAGVWTVG